MTWVTIIAEAEAGNIVTHVVPLDDMYEHFLDSECWCCPDLDEEFFVATHNSADHREQYETGERKPS